MKNEQFLPLGAMSRNEAAIKLRELGETEAADLLDNFQPAAKRGITNKLSDIWPFQDRPWQYTAHAFGFIPEEKSGEAEQKIQYAGSIPPDKELKNKQVKITLNELRVADYPGGNVHNILFEFQAKNQLKDESNESIKFSITLKAHEGQRAAVSNMPIFLGLNVGNEGLSFSCQTVNIKNDNDEKMLEFMESDNFRSGLKLLSTAQPAIGPLASLLTGFTKTLLQRNRNVKVQEFYMGLDFNNSPMSARLAKGVYIVVQIPDMLTELWDWTEWIYKTSTGNIVRADDKKTLIPFNYVVFGVNLYSE